MVLKVITLNLVGVNYIIECISYLSSILMSRQYDSENAYIGCPMRIAEIEYVRKDIMYPI